MLNKLLKKIIDMESKNFKIMKNSGIFVMSLIKLSQLYVKMTSDDQIVML